MLNAESGATLQIMEVFAERASLNRFELDNRRDSLRAGDSAQQLNPLLSSLGSARPGIRIGQRASGVKGGQDARKSLLTM